VGLNENNATPYFKLQKPGPSDSQFRTLPLPSKQQNQNVRHSFSDANHSDEATNPVLATMTLARKPKAFSGAVTDERKYKNGICVKQFDMVSTVNLFIFVVFLWSVQTKGRTSIRRFCPAIEIRLVFSLPQSRSTTSCYRFLMKYLLDGFSIPLRRFVDS
jgi:hypothetical protein